MKTHWKKLTNPNYLGSYSIDPGTMLTVTIKEVKNEMVKGTDGKEEQCIVCYLADQKPLILNKTNCKTIAKLYGTPFIEDWKGKQVTLFVAKIKAFGDTVDAIRIKDSLPKLPELTPDSEKWEGAKAALKANQVTIEQIKTRYILTTENESAIQN